MKFKDLFLLCVICLLFVACQQSDEPDNPSIVEQLIELDEKINEIEEEPAPQSTERMYSPGRYYKKLDKGAIIMLIHPKTDTTCRFVFDTDVGTPYYAKLAGDLVVDKNGKASYSDHLCKSLDFHFTKDGISVKEYKCKFHSEKIAFDGFYTTERPVNATDLLDKLVKEEEKFDFYAAFTEPFWTIYFIDEMAIFNTMEEGGPDTYTLVAPFNPNKDEQTLHFSNGRKEWSMKIRKGEGSDGMSNIIYPYEVILDGNLFGGGGTQFVKESPEE